MKTIISILLVLGLCSRIAYSQDEALARTCTEGVFTFKLPSNLTKIQGPRVQSLKRQMTQGGAELAKASGTADPRLFVESSLTFFSAYESAKGDILCILLGDKSPTYMNRDEMFSTNSERIRWGKNSGQLSKDSKGVSKLEIDGIPSLLMDIVSSNGERLQTYTFFVPGYPKHSCAINFKTRKREDQATVDEIIRSLTVVRATASSPRSESQSKGDGQRGASEQYRPQPEAVMGDARPTLQPGDMVIVATEGTRLMAGDTVIALLKAGNQVQVAKVSGKWIAVVAVVNGARTIGWVNMSDLKRVPAQGIARSETKQTATSKPGRHEEDVETPHGSVRITTPPAAAQQRFKLAITEVSLGKVRRGSLPKPLAVSPDSKHIAYFVQSGTKGSVVVDGAVGKEYDGFLKDIVFSPNSKRVAYVAKRAGKWCVVVDGAEHKDYDEIAQPIFSPNSERLAYIARVGSKSMVVVDGAVGEEYDGIGNTTPTFSSDSRRVAYPAQRGANWSVVVDAVLGKGYDGIGERTPVFSPDSKRVAFVARRGAKWLVVVDGAEGVEEDRVGPLMFSPDSKRVAHVALRDDKMFVIVDGTLGEGYERIAGSSLVFRPDSKGLAHTARSSNKWCVVLDGAREREYDAIGEGPIFSPDGRHIAYSAQRGAQWLVVVDGAPGKDYDGIGERTPIFSPDSRRVAYAAKCGRGWVVVVDGTEYKEENVGEMAFTPSSRHFAYVAQRGEKWVIVVDGIEANTFDRHVREAKLAYDTSKSFCTVVLRKKEVSHELSRGLVELEFLCVRTEIGEE